MLVPRVLPLPDLAASHLPAADAARFVLPSGGATFVTMIALLTMLSLLNNTARGAAYSVRHQSRRLADGRAALSAPAERHAQRCCSRVRSSWS
jgi:hypothetical protein